MKEEMKTFKKEIADSVEFQSKEIKELKEAKESMETNNKNQWDYLFAHRNYIQTLTDDEADQFVTDGHFWKHERKTAY